MLSNSEPTWVCRHCRIFSSSSSLFLSLSSGKHYTYHSLVVTPQVGHLSSAWRSNIKEKFIGPSSSDNFAVPGATAEDDLRSQVSRYLSLSSQTRNHETSDELESTETLYGASPPLCERAHQYVASCRISCASLFGVNFSLLSGPVLFIGINDVGCFPDEDDLEEVIENSVIDALHTLYVKAHARNFLIINIPPMDRSPGGSINSSCDLSYRSTF